MSDCGTQVLPEDQSTKKSESADSNVDQLDLIIEQVLNATKSFAAAKTQKNVCASDTWKNFSDSAVDLIQKYLDNLSVSQLSPLPEGHASASRNYPIDELTKLAEGLSHSVPRVLQKMDQQCENGLTRSPGTTESEDGSSIIHFGQAGDISVLCDSVRNLQRLVAVHQRISRVFNELKNTLTSSSLTRDKPTTGLLDSILHSSSEK
ncbi:hypothetical protein D915_008332 [Fasciola hepatica]|uniref:Uncharacterized protein n=1 Tax=Fasciola hepatica TaxID=6192 RepID=A0A4E0RHQ4_FASHE|nr:hypothetical protein D915_008332 [Fasciola hepatica]